MAESFDSGDWIKKMIASQRAIERSVEPYRRLPQQLGATLPFEQIEKVRKWANVQNSILAKNIDRTRALVEGPARQLQQAQEQLNRVLKTYDIASGLRRAADFSKQVEESYRRAMPLNWRPLTFEQAENASILTHKEGVPLVWVPGFEITAEVSDKTNREEAMAFLVDEQGRVLADIETTLAEVVHSDLVGWGGKTQEAVNAFRDGHIAPAQALAAAVVTAGLERGMRFKSLKRVRKMADDLSPDEAAFALYRTSLVLQLGSRCLQRHGFEQPGFNRGASLHEVSDDQYNSENSLAAIMVAASVLREAQELRDTGVGFDANERPGDVNGSNGTDPAK